VEDRKIGEYVNMGIRKLISISFLSVLILLTFIFTMCKDGERHDEDIQDVTDTTEPVVTQPSISKITSPLNPRFNYGDTIPVVVEPADTTKNIDSVRFYIDRKYYFTRSEPPFDFIINSTVLKTGRHTITTKVYSYKHKETNNVNITLFSDIVPVNYTYKVINTYPHDPDAYSQGLVYEDGILYEGTGQYGRSSIRKVKLETGEILESFNVTNEIFGEGITIFGDRLIQLSYRAGKGFVYNKNSFKLLHTFSYNYQEGWGLTNDGKNLIMGDGTFILYILETENFTEIDKIEVYDNTGPSLHLNELEYINGNIYANVYQSDHIVIIEPETGRVTGKIDLTNIFDKSKYHGKTDVLNGIAWDKENDRLFVTGKWWPKLYEIELVKK